MTYKPEPDYIIGGILDWMLIVYALKDVLRVSEENDVVNRDTFAQMGVELTPDQYDEYRQIVRETLHIIDWFQDNNI